jgi:hypothetical protein
LKMFGTVPNFFCNTSIKDLVSVDAVSALMVATLVILPLPGYSPCITERRDYGKLRGL